MLLSWLPYRVAEIVFDELRVFLEAESKSSDAELVRRVRTGSRI